MSFITSLVFGIISVCLGGVLGCIVCVVAGVCFHKRYLKSHFTIICILLSVAVAAAACGFIFIRELPQQFQLLPHFWIFFVSLFVIGGLSACFWKIVLPVVLLSYIIISAVTGFKLYSHFGPQLDSLQVTINQESIRTGEQTFFVDSIKNKSIVVEVYKIPGVLVLPLPRVWYSIIGVAESDIQFEPGENLRGLSGFSGQTSVETPAQKSGFLWQKQIEHYMKWTLKERKTLLVSVPENDVLPALYDLKISTEGENLSCRLVKKL